MNALKIADRVFVAPIYITREVKDETISNKILADSIGKDSEAVNNLEELIEKIKNIESSKPLCIVLMGAGDIYKRTEKI